MKANVDLAVFARSIRLRVLELCHKRKASHIGGSFSITDVLAVLYGGGILDIEPKSADSPSRDRLFYSKGHASAALYAALELRGFFEANALMDGFSVDGTYFTTHINHRVPGVELSTGSLGHALGVACGSALAGKRKAKELTVFAILSDGELDEGSNWEAILFAAHHRLDNLVLIIDFNKIQSFGSVAEIMALEPLCAKFQAFNWDVQEIDGHDHDALYRALTVAKTTRDGRPKCLVAHTTKGKGVSFMQDKLEWHYRSPNDVELEAARLELASG
jgi:transketolase